MFSGCFQCFLGVSQKSWVNLLQAISDASGKITGRPLHKSDQNSWYNLHTRTAGGSLERSLELSSRGDCTRKFQEIVPRSRPQLSCGDDDKFFTTHSPGSIQTIVNSKVGYNFCWRNTGHLSQRRDTKHRATPSNTEQHRATPSNTTHFLTNQNWVRRFPLLLGPAGRSLMQKSPDRKF